MPGLQKLGQVLARDRRLAPPLRKALVELENGMSDVTAAQIRAIIMDQLGARLETFAVKLESSIFSEASVSAVMRSPRKNAGRERERAVFKVLKPHIPDFFGEDLNLLQGLGEHLGRRNRGYGSCHPRCQGNADGGAADAPARTGLYPRAATLIEARQAYRSSIGIRVPRLVQPLCTSRITAMSEENGVKVTDAFRRSPYAAPAWPNNWSRRFWPSPYSPARRRPSFMPILMPGICSMTKRTGS